VLLTSSAQLSTPAVLRQTINDNIQTGIYRVLHKSV